MKIGHALLVDDSVVFRDTIQALLRPYCQRLRVAGTLEEGLDALATERHLDLVLSDVVLPDGDGFDILKAANQREAPRPETILATARPSPAGERIATRLGALAYLSKPLSIRDLSRAWNLKQRPTQAAPRVHELGVGEALLCVAAGSREALIRWPIRDLSASGAFLDTTGPMAVGESLNLRLLVGGEEICAGAQVVRVQEPGWGQVGGVGVEFTNLEAGEKGLLQRALHRSASLRKELERLWVGGSGSDTEVRH